MNETATYNSLGQLIEPDTIQYSFTSPGWYAIYSLLVLCILVIAAVKYRNYLKNAYRREAVEEVKNIAQHKKETAVLEINLLLKRMAIQLFGRKKVAALHGNEWFNFLTQTSAKTSNISSTNIDEFTMALYDNSYQLNEVQLKQFSELAISWIRNHRTNV